MLIFPIAASLYSSGTPPRKRLNEIQRDNVPPFLASLRGWDGKETQMRPRRRLYSRFFDFVICLLTTPVVYARSFGSLDRGRISRRRNVCKLFRDG